LEADEEIAQTKALFELEQKLWVTVLEKRNHLDFVKDAVKDAAADIPKEKSDELLSLLTKLSRSLSSGDRSKRKKVIAETASTIAEALQDLDEDRSMIGQVLSRLERIDKKVRDERAFRIAAQVKEAKHHFISENLGLVVNIAKRYHVDQMSLSDLIQEGNLGLMRAVDKFDYRKGFRFSTYASWWIRSYISRAIVRKSNTVRIPEYMLRDRNRIKRTDEAHRAKAGRSLSEDELASELGLSKKRLQRTLRHDVAFVESLDREMPGNDNQKYIDFCRTRTPRAPSR
jgi:RNA polymerase primary sigma factor